MNTALIRATSALERYLKRATFGLNAERREAVWDELEEHILTRQDGYCLLGHDPETALQLAIRELGPALRVSAGMNRVHNMPKLLSIAAVSVLSAVLLVQAGGAGKPIPQLPALSSIPELTICVDSKTPSGPTLTTFQAQSMEVSTNAKGQMCFKAINLVGSGAYIGLKDLEAALTAQGLKASSTPAGKFTVLLGQQRQVVLEPEFQYQNQGYVSAASIVRAAALTNAALSISGYDSPRITLESATFQLGSVAKPVKGGQFYPALYGALLTALLNPDPAQPSLPMNRYMAGRGATQRVRTPLKPGEAVMLVSRTVTGMYLVDIASVQKDGSAELHTPQRDLRFVDGLDQLTPSRQGRVNALLVRVTNVPLNQLKTGIFLPAQLTSDAP